MNLAASGLDNLSLFGLCMTCKMTSKSRTNNKVTKRGMAFRSKRCQWP